MYSFWSPKALKWWPYALFNFGASSKDFFFFEVCIFLKPYSFIVWKWKYFVLRYTNPFLPPKLLWKMQKNPPKNLSPYFELLHIHESSFNAEYFILFAFSSLINENCFLPAVFSAFNCGPVLIQWFCFNLHLMSSFKMFLCSNLNGFSLKFCNIRERDLCGSWPIYVAAPFPGLFTSPCRRESWLKGIAGIQRFPPVLCVLII